MTKKIGLLTFFWESNPGQLFQAYATYNALKQAFPEPEYEIELVDYRPWNRKIFFGKKELRTPYLLWLRWREHRAYRRILTESCRISRAHLYSPERDRAVAFIQKQHYDIIAVGSDVVFHLWEENLGKGTRPLAHWLPETLKCKKIALAASADATSISRPNPEQKEIMARSIQGFDYVSVRDASTRELMRQLGVPPNDVHMIPDPTFSISLDEIAELEIAKDRVRRWLPRNDKLKVGVALPPKPFVNSALDDLREKKFQVIPYRKHYGFNGRASYLPPWDWVAFLSQLDLVLTYSFHDSVFCLKQGVPFVAVNTNPLRVDPKTGLSKTATLTRRFDLFDDHYIDATTEDFDPSSLTDKAYRAIETFDKERVVREANSVRQEYLRAVDDAKSAIQ